jgi:5'-3' exonuclease
MGIPKFARFIVTRYPLVLQKLNENPDIVDLGKFLLFINSFQNLFYKY